MADEPDSIVLRYLRSIDSKLDRMADDVGELKRRATLIDERVALIRRSRRHLRQDGQDRRPPRPRGNPARPARWGDRMKRLDADKVATLGRLVCGHLWRSELSRQMGVSRQTLMDWAAGEYAPRPQHTDKAKALVRAHHRA
jgi:hypothetical protein